MPHGQIHNPHSPKRRFRLRAKPTGSGSCGQEGRHSRNQSRSSRALGRASRRHAPACPRTFALATGRKCSSIERVAPADHGGARSASGDSAVSTLQHFLPAPRVLPCCRSPHPFLQTRAAIRCRARGSRRGLPARWARPSGTPDWRDSVVLHADCGFLVACRHGAQRQVGMSFNPGTCRPTAAPCDGMPR